MLRGAIRSDRAAIEFRSFPPETRYELRAARSELTFRSVIGTAEA